VPRVLHIVVTDSFGGVERYVSDVANRLADDSWQPTVVGGNEPAMRAALGDAVRWLPGRNPLEALASVRRAGQQDVCHAHMMYAEAVGIVARRAHEAPVISTRHFAAHRGKTRVGRFTAPWIARNLACEIAISRFVADHLERPPDRVIVNGVPKSVVLWRRASRVVLVAQRLEPEKDTLTALRAWHRSGLAEEGWSLRVAGEGSERRELEAWTRSHGAREITFTGWQDHMPSEFARAGMLLASAPAEPFGLTVVEALAAGVPVVAAAGGGHLETVGELSSARLYPPGDAEAAASAARVLLADDVREAMSVEGRQLAHSRFALDVHVEALCRQYATVRSATGADHRQ
jgi:glycosyltransferase involved in cell wall biosynthesis